MREALYKVRLVGNLYYLGHPDPPLRARSSLSVNQAMPQPRACRLSLRGAADLGKELERLDQGALHAIVQGP